MKLEHYLQVAVLLKNKILWTEGFKLIEESSLKCTEYGFKGNTENKLRIVSYSYL